MCEFEYHQRWPEIYMDLVSGDPEKAFIAATRLNERDIELEEAFRRCDPIATCFSFSANMIQTGSQAIGGSFWTQVSLDTLEIGCGATLNPDTGQIDITGEGDWIVGGNIHWETTGRGTTRSLRINRVNSGQVQQIAEDTSGVAGTSGPIRHTSSTSKLVSLLAGDSLYLEVFHDDMFPINIFCADEGQGQPTATYIWGARVCGCGSPLHYYGSG